MYLFWVGGEGSVVLLCFLFYFGFVVVVVFRQDLTQAVLELIT